MVGMKRGNWTRDDVVEKWKVRKGSYGAEMAG